MSSGACVAIYPGLGFFFFLELSFGADGEVSCGVEGVEIAGAAVECFVVGFGGLLVVIRAEVGIVLSLELLGLVTHDTNNYKQDQL